MGVIYKITNPSGKLYVGKTYDLRKRINSHKCQTRKGSSIILHNSIRKYGWDAHKLEVIEEVADELLNEREMFWINELNTYCYGNPNGLNMTKGGEGQRSTWMHKVEMREKYSEMFSGEGNPFYGKKHSEETKKEIAEKARERNLKTGNTIPQWGAAKGRLVKIKPILLYNNQGKLIKEYSSLTECAGDIHMSISAIKDSAKNGSWINGEVKAEYKTKNSSNSIVVSRIKLKSVKRPILCFLNSFILEYPSAQEASSDLKIPITTIRRAAYYNNYKPIRTKHIFIYKDLHEKLQKAS